MLVLQTTHLTLSPCTPEDGNDFTELECDPEVMHFLNGGAVDHDVVDPGQVTFLMPRGHEPYVWTARRRESGAFVGWFCLYPESEQVAEIGYRLRRQDWGQGLASEGAAALLAWGFRTTGYQSVVACTMAAHPASRRVMEKLGMRHTHTTPLQPSSLPGAEHGEVWYQVTRAEWGALSAASPLRHP